MNFYFTKDGNDGITCVYREFPGSILGLITYPIEKYSELWDEAERCPLDKNKNPRFKLVNENIKALSIYIEEPITYNRTPIFEKIPVINGTTVSMEAGFLYYFENKYNLPASGNLDFSVPGTKLWVQSSESNGAEYLYDLTGCAEPTKFEGRDAILLLGTQIVTSIGAGTVFYLDAAKIIPAGAGPQTVALETLIKTPYIGGAEVDESAVVNNSTALIDQYMYNVPSGITGIDTGEWMFNTSCYISAAGGVSEIIVSVGTAIVKAGTITITGSGTSRTATVSGAAPFIVGDFNTDITKTSHIITPTAVLKVIGYTSPTVITVETLATYSNESGVAYSIDRYLFQSSTGALTNLSRKSVQYTTIQPAYPINITDRLTAHYYAKTDYVGNITIYIVHGGNVNYTRFKTP